MPEALVLRDHRYYEYDWCYLCGRRTMGEGNITLPAEDRVMTQWTHESCAREAVRRMNSGRSYRRYTRRRMQGYRRLRNGTYYRVY